MAAPEPLPIEALAEPLFRESRGRRRWLRALAAAVFILALALLALRSLARVQVAASAECGKARDFLRQNRRLARFIGAPIRVGEHPLRYRYDGPSCRMVFEVRGPRRSGQARIELALEEGVKVEAARFEQWNLVPGRPLNAPPKQR